MLTKFKLSEKGKRALAGKADYGQWVTEDAIFYFSDINSIWCDKVVSGKTGKVLDTNVYKSVDSHLERI